MPFDPANFKSLRRFDDAGMVYGLAVDWTRGRVYTAGSERNVVVSDLDLKKNDRKPIAAWAKHTNYVSCLALLPGDAPRLISGSYDKSLIWWNAASENGAGEPLFVKEAHGGWVRDVAALPGGARIVSCGDDMRLKLWDAADGALVREFIGHELLTPQHTPNALYILAVHPSGKWIASGDRTGEVKVWEVEAGAVAQKISVPMVYTYDDRARKRSIGGVRGLAFSADGAYLAVGGIGQIGNVDGLIGKSHVELWDWQAGRRLFAATADGHQGVIDQLVFTPDRKYLLGAGGGNDGGVLACWTLDPLPPEISDEDVKQSKHSNVPVNRRKIDGHVHRLAMNAEATRLLAAGHQRTEVFSLDGTE